ncbi:MAG: PASTA domain-containing protein, partial [Actinobacteria bacterium]
MRRAHVAAAIGVLLLLAAVVVAGCSSSVEVPNVRRLSLAEAKQALAERNLKVEVSSELLDDQVPKGYVVEQKPAAGEIVDADTVVSLAISAGSSGVTVPSVVGKDVEQATSELNSLGLQVRVLKTTSSEPSGTVISQSPGAGATATPDSKVDLTVAANLGTTEPTATPTPAPSTSSLVSGLVVIDPGHQARGNNEPEPIGPGSSETKPKVASGATGVATRRPEYATNLEISLKLRSYLQSRNVKVMMVRTSNDVNISNSERAQFANRARADLFVRIHCDSSENPGVNGIRTFYPPNGGWTTAISAKSELAATIVQQRAATSSHLKNLGTNVHTNQTGFNWSKVPVILVECGFLSNPSDDRLLNSPSSQQAIAKGIG